MALKAIRSAGHLVRRHWHTIEAVAADLHARGTLSGAELGAMVPGPPAGPVDPMWQALLDAEPEGELVRLRAPKVERLA